MQLKPHDLLQTINRVLIQLFGYFH